jgi:DNA-binding NtrC family response regulator
MAGELLTREDTAPEQERAAQPGLLVVFSGGQPLLRAVPAGEAPLRLGREEAGGLPLPDERLSRRHAEVRRGPGGWSVEDLDSRNGTWVDGVPVRGRTPHAAPRVLRLANTVALFLEDVGPLLGVDVTVGEEGVWGPALRGVLERVRLAAAAGEPLLITGESGTGKGLVARAYHRAGPHARGRFVAVDCAAVSPGAPEQLFSGARRGADPCVDAGAEGPLQAADGGVLFLDQLAELAFDAQARLLGVLEARELLAPEASGARRGDVHVCAATQRDLRGAVGAGQFRADLYFRLARSQVHLPPLRERPEEVPWLLVQALGGAGAPVLHATFVEACLLRPWPGNVRELAGEARRAAQAAERAGSRTLRAEHLDARAGLPLARAVGPAPATASAAAATAAPAADAALARTAVEAALAAHAGNVSATARALGLHRTQLYRLMDRLGLTARKG